MFDGGSMVLSTPGELVARAAMFEEELLVCDLEVGEVQGGSGDSWPRAFSRIFAERRTVFAKQTPGGAARRAGARARGGGVRRARARDTRLPAQDRLREGADRALRRHRLQPRGGGRGGRPRRRERVRRQHAVAIFVRGQHQRREGAGGEPGDRVPDHPDRARARGVSGDAGAAVRRWGREAGCRRGEHPVAHPRRT